MTTSFWFRLSMFIFAFMAFSCSNSMIKKPVEAVSSSVKGNLQDENNTGADLDYPVGLAKIQENDCPSCHAPERKNVGPSYAAVATKYKATEINIKMLAARIISGSVGVWGEIPMTPHSSLSREDAEEMVKYVLTLKK